ncbi:hypothetical protein V6x_52490 [Gimesia chilikensis]|uniref:Uncharacterized protein n=1 Tax=Gimesia chilikensis TaxID=2605989 RepID=A0A517WJT3_9PLAN|nr:hypothetical protein [Gimesia chilikensis]QDU05511.1 hypothetical protein V6x_52490 [Gimesia chilikensis]
MTDEEMFNEFTSANRYMGPRFDINKASPWLRARLNSAASAARFQIERAASAVPEMPPIHFDWIENHDINAWAFAYRDKYFIGINAGALIYLHSLFSRMLSNPNILPVVGNPSKEKDNRVPAVCIKPIAGMLHSSDLEPILPTDADRQFHYEYLNNQAMGFIVAHEITHLLHGHIAYAQDRFGYHGIFERGSKKEKPMPALTRQTLEMDADMGAAVAQVGMVMQLATDTSLRPTNNLARFFQTPDEAVFHFAFGICPFFRMFGDDSVPAADADIESYPPWRVRQMIAISTATYFISRRWNHDLAVLCQQNMIEAMFQVEYAYCRVTGEKMATKGLTEAWDGTGWRHVQNKLITHWREELYNELLPFSFVELPEAGNDIYA